MDVSVIIVTYNSAACIATCLDSLASQKDSVFETIVVDNASGDETLAVVKPFGVQAFANRENIGYGRANNQGFAASRGRLIYLLNPDSRLVEGDGLARLCSAMSTHPHWGLSGTRLLTAEGREEVAPALDYPGQRRAGRDFSRLPGRIAWVQGASMIVRREVYAALDGFDPGFFLYSEETDFCLRARELGHEIGQVTEVTVSHVGGASEQGRDPYEVCRRKMSGMHLFWRKHYAAQDAERLVRRDQHRARFRMLWYSIQARFQPPRSRAWRSNRENLAIWEISREFRRTLPTPER